MSYKDWNIYKLDEIACEKNNKNEIPSDIPILSVTKYDGFVPSLEYFKKQIYSKDTSKYKLVEKGDFAYATIHLDEGSIDLLEKYKHGLISPMYTVFSVDTTKVHPKYLKYLLKSSLYIQKYGMLGQGTVNKRKSIRFSILGKIKIPLPPLLEQKKNAEILSSVDRVIETTQDAIAQLQIVKRGLMQQLLTQGIPDLNNNREQVRLLDIIADLTSGVSVKGEDRIKTNNEIAVLKASAVYEGFFLPNEHKTIVDKNEQKRAKINPKKDHIIISRSNTLDLVGQSGYVEQDYPNLYLPDKLWQIILENPLKTHTKWLAYLILFLQKNGQIRMLATGTSGSMKNISKKKF